MTHYWIEPGKKDFKPFEIPCHCPTRLIKRVDYKFYFEENCWYDWQGDQDIFDMNKLGGVTDAFSANNRTSVMLTFRPSSIQGNTDVFLYFNKKDGSFSISPKLFTLEPKQLVSGSLIRNGRKWTFVSGDVEYSFTWDKSPFITRVITPYFGGENNADGPFGGVASQRMDLYLKQKVVF